MKYKSVRETAIRWGVSERIVRRYCTGKRIPGAVQIDKAWRIPANAVKPGTTPPPNQSSNLVLSFLLLLKMVNLFANFHSLRVQLVMDMFNRFYTVAR